MNTCEPSAGVTVRFRLADGVDRRIDFGGDLVVFNPESWDTHLLNGAAAAVLDAIAEAPRTHADVAAMLDGLLAEPERARSARHAHSALEQLRALGLVVACD